MAYIGEVMVGKKDIPVVFDKHTFEFKILTEMEGSGVDWPVVLMGNKILIGTSNNECVIVSSHHCSLVVYARYKNTVNELLFFLSNGEVDNELVVISDRSIKMDEVPTLISRGYIDYNCNVIKTLKRYNN